MMVLLPKEQVKAHWEYIYPCILVSLPEFAPKDEKLKARLYKYAMEGILDVWAFIDDVNSDTPQIKVIATTMIQGDPVIGNRDLLVYTFFKFHKASEEEWQTGFAELVRYAKLNECLYVTAYTNKQKIIDMLDKVRGMQKTTYLSFPVDTPTKEE